MENNVSAQNEILNICNVGVTYSGDTDAIGGINLHIYEGEFICVLGESGCGKSTLLKLLAGFLKPTEGSVFLRGKAVTDIDWRRGVVFQNPPLFEWLSVKDNIAFGPKMRGIKKEVYRGLVDDYLKKMGLEQCADMKIFELSGGMKQRVSIARTLINDPEILLMDEPFGALDAITRENIQDLLRDIWGTAPKTVFFITHDVDEALLLGTRIIVMGDKPGRILGDFEEDFSARILLEKSSHIKYTDSFYKEREKMVALIHDNTTFA